MTAVTVGRDQGATGLVRGDAISRAGGNVAPASRGRRRAPQRRGVVARPDVAGRPAGVGAPRVGHPWGGVADARPHACTVSRPVSVVRGGNASLGRARRSGAVGGPVRLTDRGIAVVLVIAAVLTVAALACIAVTAVEVTSAPARVQAR